MKNKGGEKEIRKNEWLETADEEFAQGFYEFDESDETTSLSSDEPATEETAQVQTDEVAAAEAEEDERELEEPSKDKRKWILMGMAAICVIALAAFLFSDRFYNMIQGRSSYTLEKTDHQVLFAEGNTTLLLDGNNLLRCSQDGLQALDDEGDVVWDVPFTMSSPYMLQAGEYISVADRLGTLVVLVNDGIIETEIEAEKKILLHCVNKEGATAVVLDGGDSHSVSLYSIEGDLLMQRYTYANADGIPVAIALNDDSSRMATSYIHYTGTSLQSIVTIFDLTEQGSSLVDRIVGSAVFDGCVISDLRFSGDECFFAGTDRFGSMEAGSACEILWEKELQYQIDALVMTDEFFAIRYGEGMAGTVASAENNIVVYDYSGRALASEDVLDVNYLDAWGDTIVYGVGRSYYGMSSDGSPKWQLDSIEEYSRLVAFENGDTVAALKNGQLDYYKVTLKSAMEEDLDE